AWAPAAASGGPVRSYVVTTSGGASPPAPVTVSGSGSGAPPTMVAVNGLTDGTAYTFTVAARNRFGLGPASAPTDPATPDAGLAYPAAYSAHDRHWIGVNQDGRLEYF